jgi:hypothetical protein
MKHKFVRIALFVLEVLAVLNTVAGGLALLAGIIRFPPEMLQGTPFSDYTLPGLILAIVVGGSSLVAAATVFLQREVAVLISAAAGLVLAGWIVGEVILLGPFAVTWQSPYFVLGLAIFGLASYLWMTEYRSNSFLTRHASHAY